VVQKTIMVIGAMIILLIAGNVVGDTSLSVNLNSAVVVLGGTVLSALLAFRLSTLKDLLKSLRILLVSDGVQHDGLVEEMEKLSRIERIEGIKALEREGKKVENRFLKKGIELVVDGYDRFEIRNILEKHYELYFSRKETQVNVLNTMAKLAPVFGFVGTIIGLIDVLNKMGEPSRLGPGMALALLTTFYGLLLSNFLFLPFAKKLSEHIRSEAIILNAILDGVMDIAERKHSKAISYRLNSYLGLEKVNRMKEEEEVPDPRVMKVHFPRYMRNQNGRA
jgi:chemotaxis protein MotA